MDPIEQDWDLDLLDPADGVGAANREQDRPVEERPLPRTSERVRVPIERMAPMVPSSDLDLEGDVIKEDDLGGAFVVEEGEPVSFQHARASKERLEWDAAMH